MNISDYICLIEHTCPAAVMDALTALQQVKLQPHLNELFKISIQKNLLKPPIKTRDILLVFKTTIRVFRSIDPSGNLLREFTPLFQ